MSEETKLQQEIEFFERNKAEYLKKCKGMFVLIKGSQLAGMYSSAEEAYEAGLLKYGVDEPFLVKQVLEKEPIGFAPILFLA